MTDVRAPTTTTWPTCLTKKSTRNRTSRHQIQDQVQITAAMRMLAAGVDITTIALWLGHESPRSTRPYLHADLQLKQRALDRTAPPQTTSGRYTPTDPVLAFLQAL